MIHKCVIRGCPNRSDKIIHYILPEDPIRRSLWIKFIEENKGDDEEQISSSGRVCGDHFSQEDYCSLDLGYSTQMVLSVDAVPTVQSHSEEAEVENDTCRITIAETISLACVKEEPIDYELDAIMIPQDELNSSLDECIKHEEGELAVTGEMDVEEGGKGGIDRGTDSSTKLEDYIKGCFTCLTCGNSFRTRGAFKQHQAVHTKENDSNEPGGQEHGVKENLYTCVTCGEKFRNRGVLMQHRIKHTVEQPEKKYMCHQCGKGFAHRAFLKAHQKVHEAKETTSLHSCETCGRRFPYKVSLIAHLRHHSSKVVYTCPICDENYQIRGPFVQHLKTSHAGEKLRCKTCEKCFLRVQAFVKHMERHNVVTPYYCEKCKIYQLTKRGFALHKQLHEQQRRSELQMQGLDASVENKPKRGRKRRDAAVPVQQSSSEEGAKLDIGAVNEHATVTQEEAALEPISEVEMDALAEKSVESVSEAAEFGQGENILEEEAALR